MKILTVLSLYCVLFLPNSTEAGDTLRDPKSRQAEAGAAVKEVVEGKADAAKVLAVIDPEAAVKALQNFAFRGVDDLDRSRRAKDALRAMKEAVPILREKIRRGTEVKFHDRELLRAFETMGIIGSRDAVVAMGEALFDSTNLSSASDDVGSVQVSVLAAMTLGKMNLTGAPTNKVPEIYGSSDVELWKRWWLAHEKEYRH